MSPAQSEPSHTRLTGSCCRLAILSYLAALIILLTAPERSKAQATPSQEDSRTVATGQQAASATAPETHRGPIHMVPFGPPKTLKPHPGQSNNGTVQYWGGPVISNVQVVEVLWGNFVDAPSTGGLSQFFTDITSSNYFSLLAEYSTVGLTEFGTATPGSNQTIASGTFGGKFTIAPSVCPGSALNPVCNLSDAQIQAELTAQVGAAHLPQPVQDLQGNFNTIYMVYFPPGVKITVQGISSCVQGGFCAYHGNTASGLTPKFPYGVFPDFGPTSGCSRGCGVGNSFQNLTSASSHELAEATTDVDVTSATNFAPPLGWADDITGREIGDFCENSFNDVTVTAGGNTYTVQQLWSNVQNACVSAPGHFQVTMPTTVIPGRPFNVMVTAQSSLGNQQLFNYNDTVHFTTGDANSPVLPPDYTFIFGDSGTHTFSATLNSLGPQTISVADTTVPTMIGSGTVDVEHNPDLTIASAHIGTFKQGDTADTYSITVSNLGDKATDGSTVTVTDSLPFGLTATAISGTGWFCSTPPTLTCTRSDVLAAGAAYPTITVTFSVSFSAPAQVTNTVQVAGGGEANTANDSANDVTTITQFADLVISKVHSGVFSQGQTGETYTISVTNIGQVSTTGTVTVADTLPTGLTATNIAGPGWSCSTPPALMCSRSDPLAGFSQSYQSITVTVNVDPTAPSSVTNVATVSGGGEINTGNDTASDVTTITPPAADLTIAASHSGTFAQGQAGGVLTLTASNVGPAATNATVKVADSLPFGFNAVAISGTGWTCDLPSVSCTRSDALAALSAYSPITVQVSVGGNASLTVLNFASVSGGGEVNTVNDNASDSITVTPAPDLQLLVNAPGMTQGQTGVAITTTTENLTGGTTSGTVTVVQTLPPGFTANSLTGSGWTCVVGTLTCTRSDSLGPFSNYPTISLTVDIALNAPRVFQMTMTVSGGGEANTGNDTSTVGGNLATPITINPTIGSATVSAGGTGNFSLNVFSVVPGSTTLTCSGLPLGTACNFNPASFNPTTSSQVTFTPVTLAITTSGGLALGAATVSTGQRTISLASFVFPLLALAIVAGTRRRRLRGRRMLVCLAGAVSLLLLGGCGGGTPHGPPPVVTPSGTYAITVTANNAGANTQTTATVTLVVR